MRTLLPLMGATRAVGSIVALVVVGDDVRLFAGLDLR
jgi:hypothetical protein